MIQGKTEKKRERQRNKKEREIDTGRLKLKNLISEQEV